jgi:hypothetical protein
MLDALKAYRKSKGKPHPIEAKALPMPRGCADIMRHFNVISRGRPLSAGGWMPIPISEIEAWARLRQITFKPWQLDALLRLDHVWLSVMAAKTHDFEDDD